MSQQSFEFDLPTGIRTEPQPESAPITVYVAATGRTARIAALDAVPQLETSLVLAPTAALATWNALSRERHQTLRVETPETYLSRLVRQRGLERFVTFQDRLLLLSDLIEDLASELTVLADYARSVEFCREFSLLIGELRRAELTAIPPGGDWSRDLQTLLAAYDELLADIGAYDVESVPTLTANLAEQNRLPVHRSLILELPLDVSPALWRAVAALCASAGTVAAPLVVPGLLKAPQDWQDLASLLDGHALQPTVQRWQELGAQLVPCEFRPNAQIRAAAQLMGWCEQSDAPANVTLTQAHDPWDEMSRLASAIRRGQLEEHAAVAVPDATRYNGVLEAAFKAHDVPVNVARTRPVSASSLVARLLRVLAYDPRAVELDDLLELYGDGIVVAAAGERCLDPRRLREACRAARITRLSDLPRLEQRMRDAVSRLEFRKDSPEFSRRQEEQLNALLACLNNGDIQCLAALNRASRARSATLTPADWADLADEFLDSCAGHLLPPEMDDELEIEIVPEELEPWQIAARQQLHQVRSAIARVVERAARWAGERPRRGSDYGDWLRIEIDAASAVEAADGVPVTGLQVLESGAEGTIFLGGLLEGEWPESDSGGALIARHRRQLSDLYTHRPASSARGLYQLARAISEADDLYLSYPAFQQGKETLRSPLIEDLYQNWPQHQWPALQSLMRVQPTARSQRLTQLGNGSLDTLSLAAEADWLAHLRIMRTDRRDPAKLGPFDGVLGDAGPALMRRYFESRAKEGEEAVQKFRLSPTAIERYARCALRFFFVDILDLTGHSSFDEDLAANEQGDLVHRILERFHREFPISVSQEEWEAAWNKLEDTASREINGLTLRRILREAERRRLLGDGTPLSDGRPGGGLLAKILHAECEQASGQLAAWAIPVMPLPRSDLPIKQTEYGLETPIRLVVPRPDGELQTITGRIDRIDVSRFGDLMVVVDYKTGSKANLATFASMEAGQDFQLALYLLELRRRYASEATSPHFAAAYFVLQEAEFSRGIGMTGSLGKQRTKSGAVGSRFVQSGARELSEQDFNRWLDGIAARAGQIGQLIENGVFNLTLLDNKTAKCRYCECQSLCGMNADTQPARALAHQNSKNVYAPLPILSD